MEKVFIILMIQYFMVVSRIMFFMEMVNKKERIITLKEFMNMEIKKKAYLSIQEIFMREASKMMFLREKEF